MAKTGPQTYPGAERGAHWYQDSYPGDSMESNVGVLHTTEGTSVPSYSGGAVAPNFTAEPDIKNRRLRWFQHFDFDTSSRALENHAGGVETNTMNAVQIELVGTCDPKHRKSWGNRKAGRDYLYWPDAPDWALAGLAEFVKWAHDEHGIKLASGLDWRAYPDSYGAGGQRMSGSEWLNFYGWCGHQHVPENVHGDPGDLDMARVLELAKGAKPREDDGAAPQGGTSGPVDDGGEWPRYQVTINGLSYGYGAEGDQVTEVGRALVKHGCGDAYEVGPGPHWTDADTANYSAWQRKCGYSGKAADGVPGETSLRKLLGHLPGSDTVDLSKLRAAARSNPPAAGQPVTYDGVSVVEAALVAEGLLAKKYADGHFGTTTVRAYSRWQRRCGFSGAAACDGIPGSASLRALARKHGFRVVA